MSWLFEMLVEMYQKSFVLMLFGIFFFVGMLVRLIAEVLYWVRQVKERRNIFTITALYRREFKEAERKLDIIGGILSLIGFLGIIISLIVSES